MRARWLTQLFGFALERRRHDEHAFSRPRRTRGATLCRAVSRNQHTRGVRGYDGHKNRGRKRHTLVDSSGLLLGVKVLPANQTDRSGGATLLSAVRNAFPSLQHVWADQGYKVIARRWVVERTFAWWTFQRRLNRDYELLPACTECFIYATMIRRMVRRLAC